MAYEPPPVVDPNQMTDYGMPAWWNTIQTPENFYAADIRFTADSKYGDYNLSEIQKLGITPGSQITGIDKDSFLITANPFEDTSIYSGTSYSKKGEEWQKGEVTYGKNDPMEFGDALKIAAPILLSAIPGVGAGLSAFYGGGTFGAIGAGATLGGVSSAISGDSILQGALLGGVGAGVGQFTKAFDPISKAATQRGVTSAVGALIKGQNPLKAGAIGALTAGISSAITPVFGTSIIGRTVGGAVTGSTTAALNGGDPFSAGVLGAIGGANVGKSIGLEGQTASFVNQLANLTAQVQLQQRKQKGG